MLKTKGINWLSPPPGYNPNHYGPRDEVSPLFWCKAVRDVLDLDLDLVGCQLFCGDYIDPGTEIPLQVGHFLLVLAAQSRRGQQADSGWFYNHALVTAIGTGADERLVLVTEASITDTMFKIRRRDECMDLIPGHLQKRMFEQPVVMAAIYCMLSLRFFLIDGAVPPPPVVELVTRPGRRRIDRGLMLPPTPPVIALPHDNRHTHGLGQPPPPRKRL